MNPLLATEGSEDPFRHSPVDRIGRIVGHSQESVLIWLPLPGVRREKCIRPKLSGVGPPCKEFRQMNIS